MSGLTIGGLRKVGTMHNKLPKTFEKKYFLWIGAWSPRFYWHCRPSDVTQVANVTMNKYSGGSR